MIAAALRDSPPPVEATIFGTRDGEAIARVVDGFCAARLRSHVKHYEFFASSVGSVHGLRLVDDRRVVLKAHRRDESITRLLAVQRVQQRLADAGFPAPRPLLEPTPIADGIAVVEALLDRGVHVNGHHPRVRRAMAAWLARLVALTRDDAAGLEPWRSIVARQWREPHDERFDFAGTAAWAGWIDELSEEALDRIDHLASDECVIGHGDWRVQHLRFRGTTLTAVYDWDSLSMGPEPAFAGNAAHAFTADWSQPRPGPNLPQPAESLRFLDDYQAARGRPFTDREACVARAALVDALAYSARCELSDRLTGGGAHPPVAHDQSPFPKGGFLRLLHAHGKQLLGPRAR